MRNPVGLCICISEDRHSIASPRVSCKARNGDTSSLRSSNSGLCWRRPWPCFSGHVSTSFGFAKSLKSPKMEALTPLTAILTREQVGRAEKIEPAPWISDQASSSRIPWCCYTPSLSSHLAVCLFAWFAYGIYGRFKSFYLQYWGNPKGCIECKMTWETPRVKASLAGMSPLKACPSAPKLIIVH